MIEIILMGMRSLFSYEYFPFIVSCILLVLAAFITLWIVRMEKIGGKAGEILAVIHDGTKAYTYKTIRDMLWVSILLSGLILLIPFYYSGHLDWLFPGLFLLGIWSTTGCGLAGLHLADCVSGRIILQASRKQSGYLYLTFLAANVTGFLQFGVNLIIFLLIYHYVNSIYLICFLLGTAISALFLRVAGGVFVNSADMGSDLTVGLNTKAGGAASNCAMLADKIGNNVSDISGFGVELLSTLLLALLSAILLLNTQSMESLDVIVFQQIVNYPILLVVIGMLSAVAGLLLGLLLIRINKYGNLLMNSIYLTILVAGVLGFLLTSNINLSSLTGSENQMFPFYICLMGLAVGAVIGFTSEYYSSSKYAPLRRVVEIAERGAALTVLAGFSLGMRTNFVFTSMVLASLVTSYYLLGFLGVTLVAIGVMIPCMMIIAVNAFGSIGNYALETAVMAEEDSETLRKLHTIDSLGYTTASVGKGFAAGAAFLASMSIVYTFVVMNNIPSERLNLLHMPVLIGLFMGALLPYIFSALLLSGVITAVNRMIEEVTRQFREIPYLLEGKAKPDMTKCVHGATTEALNAIVWPGLLAFFVPIIIGFFLYTAGLAGLMIGTILSGFLFAYQYGNTGGALDNVKEYIEKGYYGGPGTERHKATLIADNVGDALKDSLGPSVNIMVKIVVLVSLLMGLFILQ